MTCPYRGLNYFREEDADFFFGRDRVIDRLVEKVKHHTLLAVVGASGSGKSSVVRAGLVPRLRKKNSGAVWDVVTMIPGEKPLHSLAKVILPLIEPELSGRALVKARTAMAKDLQSEEIPLWDLVGLALEQQRGTDRVLLVVDQWEELYTECEDVLQRQRFIEELLAATAIKNSPLTVILTVRDDFYGKLLENTELMEQLGDGRVDISPMKREELEAAIVGPSKIVDLTFEAGLVSLLLDDAGQEPGNLPLLEFTLQQLWEKRSRGAEQTLTHEAYNAIGRLVGAIATHAEAVYEELEDTERDALPNLFRRLVRAGAQTEEDTRRRAVLAELDETAQRAAQKLADKRLLITTRSDGGQELSGDTERTPDRKPSESVVSGNTVEVSHES